MSLGPIMIDVEGEQLSVTERGWLEHPLVGGVILFSRNFSSIEQLTQLVAAIRSTRAIPPLVAVDHEGGRVQRFKKGFTRLPAAALLGQIYPSDRARARRLAEQAGWVMAIELRTVGIDFSFAPVLDINKGISGVIGDRAFFSTPDGVTDLALSYMAGMKRAGMAAVGKHFPGHGGVEADSHLDLPIDERDINDLRMEDLLPFRRLIENGLDGVMPAHVLYPRVDSEPAGFSSFWLQRILRRELGFQGVIFSDDLSMEGAKRAGTITDRAIKALNAGCDMVLVCNDPAAVSQLLHTLPTQHDPVHNSRLARLHGRKRTSWAKLHNDPHWHQAVRALSHLQEPESGWLDLKIEIEG